MKSAIIGEALDGPNLGQKFVHSNEEALTLTRCKACTADNPQGKHQIKGRKRRPAA
ncbi:hypothetical protein AGR4A_Cc230006 [Agrobacterium tumefaciens str. B6]|uniref:Uncharacterized protein n=1 Tax=Agrobacterium tumefaciens str. B6 TaxID=1183423 RepID=A0A822UXS5_AGRTU|nr:hypothetical protein AGR4A_Cc230006 [Agrobacterium tumefaciens str. B6]